MIEDNWDGEGYLEDIDDNYDDDLEIFSYDESIFDDDIRTFSSYLEDDNY